MDLERVSCFLARRGNRECEAYIDMFGLLKPDVIGYSWTTKQILFLTGHPEREEKEGKL